MIIKTITAYVDPSDIDYQDGGQAQIITLSDDSEEDLDEGLFVRIQSWYEKTQTHPEIELLKGKRVKVTIETLEDEKIVEELPEPIGNFILNNAIGVQATDGKYYHYSEVCILLAEYLKSKT